MRLINKCVNKQILDICQQSMQLDELNQKLLVYLNPALLPHCSVSSFNKGTLVLTVTDPVWATTLRYELPALRDRLRKEAGLYQLTSIQIKIGLHSQVKSVGNKNKKPAKLSHSAAQTLIAASTNCDFQPLKQALMKLAKLGEE